MAPPRRKQTYKSLNSDGSRASEELESSDMASFAPLSYEKPYKRMRMITIFLTFALILTASYAVYVHTHSHSSDVLLGADPFEMVPSRKLFILFGSMDFLYFVLADHQRICELDIGEPRKWVSFDERDPYYIDYDVFDSLEKIDKIVLKINDMNNPGILTNGYNSSYVHVDGKVRQLHPTNAYKGKNQFPVVFLRAFHQMHCIALVTESYGYAYHGKKGRWDNEHIAHCMNVLRESVSCLADAGIATFTYKEDHHIGRDQMVYCRNYDALREWADDPSRAAYYDIVENLKPKDL
ncbi:thioesterase [Paramyrothecium foliicola]|nr:thioesterase [Paramyrothecium foliicola]